LMTQNVAGENGLDLDLDPVTEQNWSLCRAFNFPSTVFYA
jgi:hypothetical protein